MSQVLGLGYGLGFCFLGLFGFRMLGLSLALRRALARQPERRALDPQRLPQVTVQLPVYNERFVAARAIDALCRLRWPADRLEIQVLDDSDDVTRDVIDARATVWRARGVDLQVIRRGSREGYKAGALAAGLALARGEALAVFDADFLPPPDFLERSLPYLAPGIGAVQARWGHLNADRSCLTRAQALALDGHFLVEQVSQARLGLFLNFNGTAGVWRREAIESAGGWQSDTLTEDFDLSYRAQLAGWRIQMLPDLVAPAELPDTLPAYRRQQRRWAMGTVQVLRKLGRALLSADRPIPVRLLALLTLAGYLVHPVMLALLLGAPLLLIWPPVFPAGLSLLTLAPLCPPILYAVGLCRVEPGWRRRLLRDYPGLALLTVGMALAGSRAVFAALLGQGGAFERTPKRGLAATGWTEAEVLSSPIPASAPRPDQERADAPAPSDPDAYRLPLGRQSWAEGLLAAYAWGLVLAALWAGVGWLAGFGLLYALGFSLVVGLALRDRQSADPRLRGERRTLPA